MKKSILSLMAAVMLLWAVPAFASADEKANEVNTSEAAAEITAAVKAHVDRLSEIKAMDFSEMTSSEKKELRKEVREISKEMKALGKADAKAKANSEATAEASQAGIYISGSAIIIILLLLLLL